jgi:hypothetical protein
MGKIVIAAISLCLLLVSPMAYAQDRVRADSGRLIPSDEELKATYCMAVSGQQRQELGPAVTSLLSSSKSESDPRTARMLSQAAHDSQIELTALDDRIARISSFIVPRQRHLDSVSILAALKRGEVDYAASNAAIKQCQSSCSVDSGQEQCLADCIAQDEVLIRIRQCHDLTFLPY